MMRDERQIQDVNDPVAVEIGCVFAQSVGNYHQIQDIHQAVAIDINIAIDIDIALGINIALGNLRLRRRF